jgi:hypothetical protein
MFFEVIIFLIIMVKHKEKTMVGRGRWKWRGTWKDNRKGNERKI